MEDFHLFIMIPRTQTMMAITAITNEAARNRSSLLQLRDTRTGEVCLLPPELK